jgi:hypothetical protein
MNANATRWRALAAALFALACGAHDASAQAATLSPPARGDATSTMVEAESTASWHSAMARAMRRARVRRCRTKAATTR